MNFSGCHSAARRLLLCLNSIEPFSTFWCWGHGWLLSPSFVGCTRSWRDHRRVRIEQQIDRNDPSEKVAHRQLCKRSFVARYSFSRLWSELSRWHCAEGAWNGCDSTTKFEPIPGRQTSMLMRCSYCPAATFLSTGFDSNSARIMLAWNGRNE